MSLRRQFQPVTLTEQENAQILQHQLSASKQPDPIEALQTATKFGRPHSGKVVVSLRLEPDVIEKFRATGPGWQARMNDVLKAAKV